MSVQVWDIEAAFLLGRFASEEEALKFVRMVLANEGDAYVENLRLILDDEGRVRVGGAELLRRARALDAAYAAG